MVSDLYRTARAGFEAGAYLSFWLSACALAAIAGRPWLGAIGLVTVLPFVVLALRSPKRGR